MSRDRNELTVTSYAILGLLAIQPWTTYELAQQMERSLRNFWPRAQSRIYEEPKRLVERGLASAEKGATGQRPRTVYSITHKGRRALSRWLAQPGGAGPQLEFELLLKVFFAEHAKKGDALANIAAIKRWADAATIENISFARQFGETGGPFPERIAQIVLIGRFLTDFADMVNAWTRWAEKIVSAWPDDPKRAEPDRATLDEVARRRLPDLQEGG